MNQKDPQTENRLSIEGSCSKGRSQGVSLLSQKSSTDPELIRCCLCLTSSNDRETQSTLVSENQVELFSCHKMCQVEWCFQCLSSSQIEECSKREFPRNYQCSLHHLHHQIANVWSLHLHHQFAFCGFPCPSYDRCIMKQSV